VNPPPRRQPPDVRREQILDAAQQVLLRQGPAAATMADVADAASVAKGTVYLYFASKAELLAGLRARYFERLTAVLGDQATARAGAPSAVAARIEALVAASYDFALANHELHHVLFHEAGLGEHDTFARVRDAVAELVASGAATGELDVEDPALATDFVLHGLHGILVAATHRPRSHRRRLVDAVTRLVCGALGARPAATSRRRARASGHGADRADTGGEVPVRGGRSAPHRRRGG
jgi:TetR/AcrR family transcriptional regulator, transcriptional repressor for nem operon